MTYLQLVCLAENVRTRRDDIASLVEFFDSDLRRSLTALQFWAESGGSCQPIRKPYENKASLQQNGASVEDNTKTQDIDSQDSQDEQEFTALRHPGVTSHIESATESQNSEDDFELPKVKINRKTRLLTFDDESSLDSLPSTAATPQKCKQTLLAAKPETSDNGGSQDEACKDVGTCSDLKLGQCVAVHDGVFDFQLNVHDVGKVLCAPDLHQVRDLESSSFCSFFFACTSVVTSFQYIARSLTFIYDYSCCYLCAAAFIYIYC